MGISTHILDTSRGRPADDVAVELDHQAEDGAFVRVAGGVTDGDGRLKLVHGEFVAGTFRLRFAVGAYFKRQGQEAFFPVIDVLFMVHDTARNYHVPLLLNPFGYSTYRGS